MTLLIDAGIAFAILFGAQAMAAYRWPNHPWLRYLCGVGAILCAFGLVWVILFGVLGFVRLDAIQKGSIATAVLLLVFTALWPAIKRGVGPAPSAVVNPTPATVSTLRVYTLPSAQGGTAFAAQMTLRNDGDDATYSIKSGAVFQATTADANEWAAHLRALATELVARDAAITIPSFRIARGDTVNFDSSVTAIFAPDYKKYQDGEIMYYFVGRVRLTYANGGERIVGYGGIAGAKSPAILSCPDDVLKILEGTAAGAVTTPSPRVDSAPPIKAGPASPPTAAAFIHIEAGKGGTVRDITIRNNAVSPGRKLLHIGGEGTTSGVDVSGNRELPPPVPNPRVHDGVGRLGEISRRSRWTAEFAERIVAAFECAADSECPPTVSAMRYLTGCMKQHISVPDRDAIKSVLLFVAGGVSKERAQSLRAELATAEQNHGYAL